MFPAQSYTNTQQRILRDTMYDEWISEIPYTWVKSFCINGLTPFLRKYGYTLSYDMPTIVSYCKEWAFSHVLLTQLGSKYKSRKFMKCAHTGGHEEQDLYHFTIPTHEWEVLSHSWATTEFLDDSDAGYSQRMDLCQFVWNLINLDESKTQQRWNQHMENSDQQDDDTKIHFASPDE